MSGIHQSIDLSKDCNQLAWDKIRIIFNFHEVQLTSCFYVMILQLPATSKPCWHSLSFTLASPKTTKAKKNPCYCTGQKFHLQLVIGQSCSFVTCEKNYPTYQNLCSLLQILFVVVVVVVVVKLAWGKSQYVYDKQI